MGTVNHEKIWQIMETSNALIMPFKQNDFTNTINPVKLYEYIYAHKPVISIYTTESKEFKDYIYLYNKENEYFNLLELLLSGELTVKKNVEESTQFCIENSWKRRIEEVYQIIESRSKR
jgi:hypothetical protein